MRLTTQYFSNKIREIENVPLFSAMSSFLHETSATKTKIAFTSILPYVATEYDTIHTVMWNFQNIFLQNSESYGPLWYDEGVFWLAKELQFLDPANFCNIFLGIGRFHTEKVMITCSGKYLEDTEIRSILVENQVYGSENVKHFMNGDHYFCGIRGMAIVSEVLYGPLLDQFLIEKDENTQN